MEDQTSQEEPRVLSINISKGGIPKLPVKSVFIKESGLEGDGHNHQKHYRLEQAVCFQDIEKLEDLQREGYAIEIGTIGENITVKGLNVNDLPLGTLLEFPSGLKVELSKVRVSCYVLDAIDSKLKDDITGRCGMYAKVIKEGIVSTNDVIKVIEPSKVE